MKPDNENRMSLLLDRFFDGATTPAEEAELERLLDEADTLPAGKESDRMTFMLCRRPQAVAVPAGLKERLESAIDKRAKEELAEKAKATLKSRRRIVWGVAAAVITIAILIPAIRPGKRSPLPADEAPITLAKAPTIVDSVPAATKESPMPRSERTETRHICEPAATALPTRVISDPDEAAVYLAKVFSKIEKTKRSTDRQIAECDRLLERAGQAIDKASDIVEATADTQERNPA